MQNEIAFEEPIPPRRLNRLIPVELETIVLKALAKQTGDRYLSSQALADDLKAYLEYKPIQARRSNPLDRAAPQPAAAEPLLESVIIGHRSIDGTTGHDNAPGVCVGAAPAAASRTGKSPAPPGRQPWRCPQAARPRARARQSGRHRI